MEESFPSLAVQSAPSPGGIAQRAAGAGPLVLRVLCTAQDTAQRDRREDGSVG